MRNKVLIAGITTFLAGAVSAQCTITGATTPVCENGAVQNLSTSANYLFIDSVQGNTFNPATAGAGTHTVQAYSNTNIWSYNVSEIGTFAPEPFTGATLVTLGDDQVSGVQPIGFNFTFFGNTYSQFYISSNGFISFDPAVSQGCCSGGVLPTNDAVNNVIAWDWNDLYPPGGGQVGYKTIGTAPNRTLIVYYQTVSHCCGTDASNTGQIKLFEGSNRIEIHTTATTSDGSVATQGIENANGTIGFTTPGRNSQNWTSGNHFVSFTPQVTYAVNQIGTFSPEAIVGTTVTLSDDQVSGAIPVGFDFNFFGNNYNQLYISSNGFVSFDPFVSQGCCQGEILPSNDAVNNVIAWDWNDLYPPTTGTIRYQTLGTAPNRRMIINFNTLSHCCGSDGSNTGQIKLFEGTNIIQLHVTSTTDDGSVATQGIENANGTVGYAIPGRNSQNWTASNYFAEFVPANICATSTIVVNGATTSTQTQTACGSYTWPVNGSTYSTGGAYTHTLLGGNALGCDSTITLNLTITAPATGVDVVSDCDSYTWIDGNTYTSNNNTATYTILGGAANGCDSIVTLNLTINNSTTGSETVTECGSYVWAADGNTYSASGTYTATLANSIGCDSVVTLNLTINTPTSGSETVTECGNYVWAADGNTYSASGTYTATLTNAAGCDSVVTLNLTINTPTSGSETVSTCDSYVWAADGNTYSTSGTYTATLANAAGCDSVVTLNLTITTSPTATATDNGDATISASTGTAYQWIDCGTGAAIAGETAQTFTATTNGSYAVVVTSGNCSDTSSCVLIDYIGIKELASDLFVIHPNPSTGQFFISLKQEAQGAIQIYAADGSLVYNKPFNGKQVEVNLSQVANGTYTVHVETTSMKRLQKIVINH